MNCIWHLRFINKKIIQIDQQLKPLVEQTGLKFHTLTGVDTVMAAKLITLLGDINRFALSAKLAKYAGIAQQQKSSGKKQRFKKSIPRQQVTKHCYLPNCT
jgi:transposase